jgi:hypothetical protein
MVVVESSASLMLTIDGRETPSIGLEIRSENSRLISSIADRRVVTASTGEISVNNIPIASTTPVHPRRMDVDNDNEFLTVRTEH